MRLFYKTKKLLLIAAAMFSTSMAFAQDYGVVWSQDFEDVATYTEGWTVSSPTRNTLQSGSNYLHFYNTTGSTSFTGNTNFIANDYYKFEFDWNAGSGNNKGTSTMNILADNENGKLFYAVIGNDNAGWNSDVVVYKADGTLLTTTTADGYQKEKAFSFMFHCVVESTSEGVTLTMTKGEETVLATTTISNDVVHITGMEFNTNTRRAMSMGVDNLSLSVLGASEGITIPSCAITATYNETRTITVTPGVGTEGTAAEFTYYTTDGSDPSKENGTPYAEPFTISETSTIKVISYLPDGTASEVFKLKVEAGTVMPLNSNIVDVTELTGEGDTRNAIVSNVYTSEGILGTPEATITCTFNEKEITLPYTVTEDGTFVATASADGYGTTTETFTIYGSYVVKEHVDFTAVTEENMGILLGDSWTYNGETGRWSFWGETTYYSATCSSNQLTDFLYSSNAKTLLIGFGVGYNKGGASFSISTPVEGDIALYVMDESYNKNDAFKSVEHVSAYVDDNSMSYASAGGTYFTLAKASVYTPVRELVIDDNAMECDDFTPKYDSYSKITYNREFKQDYYYLMVLPFAPDVTSLENYNFYKLSSVADDAVTFEIETAPVANTPYLCCLKTGATVTSSITSGPTTVSTEVNNVTEGNWTLIGSLTNTTAPASDNYLLHPYNHKLHKVTSDMTVYPYTAYLQKSSTGITVAPATMRLFISGPTGIKEISVDRVEGIGTGCFDLQGRPITKPMKGQIYIKDGKKIMH